MYDVNGWKGTAVNILSGTSSPFVQIDVESGATRIFCRLKQSNGSSGDIIYTDNWCLEEI